MKKGTLVENERIILEDIEPREPEDDECLVLIVSCGICGSDVPRYFDNAAHFYPLVLGHEFYGVVKSIGKAVKRIKVGDHVVGIPLIPCFDCSDCQKGDYSLCKNYKFIGSSVDGGFCEEGFFKEMNLFKIDKEYANKYCALFEPATIALHGIKMVDNLKDKKVAIIGGGTIGLFASKWATIYKVGSVGLFVRRNDNNDLYSQLGINHIYLSDKNSLEKDGLQNKYELVFDAVGSNASINTSLDVISNHGVLIMIGTPSSDITFTKKQWEKINRKELTIKGTWMSYSFPFPGNEWEETRLALKNNLLRFDDRLISKEYPLSNINEAFQYIRNVKNKKPGRVLIVNDEIAIT